MSGAQVDSRFKVTCSALSHDGRYLFTAGGEDLSLSMWDVDVNALDATANLGGEGVAPFLAMVDGGVDGPVVDEMKDLFYYAQLKRCDRLSGCD